ncbi:hypothetical protein [Streptomyces sp. NBC_01216]|uniref:hypothetical protein n=1 Tax=unclassified Streptomyces TaxID=2593676 RepID=UPI002E12DA60|nr:hypothetical protein OG393_23020 [Streptomyces sp. NBC_01216]
MTQHVRRKLARILPTAPETSIPLSAVLQTGVSSVSMTTLRFSSLLTLGVIVAPVYWQQPVPAQLLLGLSCTAALDRSGFVRLKVRRFS